MIYCSRMGGHRCANRGDGICIVCGKTLEVQKTRQERQSKSSGKHRCTNRGDGICIVCGKRIVEPSANKSSSQSPKSVKGRKSSTSSTHTCVNRNDGHCVICGRAIKGDAHQRSTTRSQSSTTRAREENSHKHRCADRGDGVCIVCETRMQPQLSQSNQSNRAVDTNGDAHTKTARFCHHCGSTLAPPGAAFCSLCGSEVQAFSDPVNDGIASKPATTVRSNRRKQETHSSEHRYVRSTHIGTNYGHKARIAGFVSLPCALIPIAGFWIPLMAIIWGVKGRKLAQAAALPLDVHQAQTGIWLGSVAMFTHAVLVVGVTSFGP
jgi:hypothetical protein